MKKILVISGIILSAILVLFLSLVFVLSIFDCWGRPSEEEVKQEFLMSNPSAEVIGIIGYGDDCAVTYFDIDYRQEGKGNTKKARWVYINQGGGKWEKRDITTPP